MLKTIRAWFGLVGDAVDHGTASHGLDHHHGHTHGVVDASIATTDRGIWAVKWSFVILAVTAACRLAVALLSSSVALLAETIHNIGDATTAVPLWIAFALARRPPRKDFTYGYGRAEDFAGLIVVAVVLFSALVAGYEAVDRFLHPKAVASLGWVIAAGLIGFAGNETVAVLRIRAGREISSAALVADGYHARSDGLTSLAVVVGAAGVWLGFPLADPVIGLLITVAILGIVWQSSRAVLTRMLDGNDPALIGEIRHAAAHVARLKGVPQIQALARAPAHRRYRDRG